MSDRDDDLCYWNGEPINAMTREALQKALGDAVMIIEQKNDIIDFIAFKLVERFHNETPHYLAGNDCYMPPH